MIVFTHRPARLGALGWEFDSDHGDMSGAGRTLDASVECANHAARCHLSRLHGYAIDLQVARYQADHVVPDAPADTRAAELVGS